MNFKTPYTTTPDPGETNDGKLIVEVAGYVPQHLRIQQMIDAGERLNNYRKGYDFEDGEDVPDDFYDPTRDRGFDMADASMMREQSFDNIRESLSRTNDVDIPPKQEEKTSDENNLTD